MGYIWEFNYDEDGDVIMDGGYQVWVDDDTEEADFDESEYE